ncbi:MAG TPA: sulfotransferase [Spongiibacteraceae bacterium]|nr:sulfotransferase [Spongiibacteraceae bacterium]
MLGVPTDLKSDISLQFMLPGFSKCGTTTLCALLDEHPDICISSIKEPNFFTWDDYDQRWDFYTALFPRERGNLLFGEGTTMYSTLTYGEVSRDRILQHFPEIKLIFLARDPLKRIESSFREFHHSGVTFGIHTEFDIDKALAQLPQLIDDSLYFARLGNYLQRVPPQRILVVLLEDLVANTEFELRRCFNFLGLDPAPAASIRLRSMNAGAEKLYDTKLLRRLQSHPYWSQKLAKVSLAKRDRVFKALGLRQPFVEKMQWSPAALDIIANALADDVQHFLQWAGKDIDYWPHFAKTAKTYCRRRPQNNNTAAIDRRCMDN